MDVAKFYDTKLFSEFAKVSVSIISRVPESFERGSLSINSPRVASRFVPF
jgi:hypothetical protein